MQLKKIEYICILEIYYDLFSKRLQKKQTIFTKIKKIENKQIVSSNM